MQDQMSTAAMTNERALDEIRQVVAGGVSSNMRVRGFTVPLVIQRASGNRIWDIEGNELIDVNMGYGPHLFGYADAQFADDVTAQLWDGTMTGLPHRMDRRAAELIVELVPSIDQVRFANSGTEALMSSVRLARMATGRMLVVTFESHYHGWSETLLRRPVTPGTQSPRLEPGPVAGAPGMIPESLNHTLQIPWNDPDSLREIFTQYGDRIAAVFCEPVLANAGVVPPAPGFLELLRETTTRYGALLVFDEVITGFRVARDCAQGHYGVSPDLTVVSKVLGGGFPVAAFGGTSEWMAPLARNEAFHAGVYSGNHGAMAAVVSMLSRIRDCGDRYERLDALGHYAEVSLREVFATADRPIWIGRVGSLMSVALASQPVPAGEETLTGPALTDFVAHRELQARCQRAGVYFHPDPHEPWFLSTKHTVEDIDAVCSVIAKALAAQDRRGCA
jgi:glutamate-1-semialdehyde 2,1-aminomutase